MGKLHLGDPVEVTLEDGTTKIGRLRWLYDQYNSAEVSFADTSVWIGEARQVRSLESDELELRAQAPKTEKPVVSGKASK